MRAGVCVISRARNRIRGRVPLNVVTGHGRRDDRGGCGDGGIAEYGGYQGIRISIDNRDDGWCRLRHGDGGRSY